MFATSEDVLNMSLAIGFIVLVIFLSILIFYAILILRDVSRTTQKVEEVVDQVYKTITEPLRALDYIIEKAKPYLEVLVEKWVGGKKKGK